MYEQNITAFSPKPLFLSHPLFVLLTMVMKNKLKIVTTWGFLVIVQHLQWDMDVGGQSESHMVDSLLDFHAPF